MSDSATQDESPRHTWRRWVAIVVFGTFFVIIMWTVINPYRDQPYEEIPHGDHVHYVPKDRDLDVPVSRFPTRPPEPDERITPDGQVVPATGQGTE